MKNIFDEPEEETIKEDFIMDNDTGDEQIEAEMIAIPECFD